MNRLLLSSIEKSLIIFHQLIPAMVLKTPNSASLRFARTFTRWQTCFQQKAETNNPSSNGARPTTSQQKKFKVSPKITLIGLNKAMSVSSLEEAQKLAKRRDLHLVQVDTFDSKTQRPIYKLVTGAEMIDENLQETQTNSKDAFGDKAKSLQNKSEKVLTIGSRITDHDLASRLKHISKWLGKHHEVRVLIQGSATDMSSCEKITKTIEDFVKEPQVIGKIINKHKKGACIKFNILPVAPVDTSADTEDVSPA